MKPIAILKTSKEFLDLYDRGLELYSLKINMMITELQKQHEWLPDCCKINAHNLQRLADDSGETYFYVECQNEN